MIRMGVEYFLIGIFLIFVVQAVDLRNEFAGTRNNRTDTTRQIQEYRAYSKFNQGICTGSDTGQHVFGDDIIEAIRGHEEGDLEIYVDHIGPGGASLYFDREEAKNHPEKYTVASLQTILNYTSEYHPYLIYNGNDPRNPTFYKEDMGEVTGIAFIWVREVRAHAE